MAITLTKSTEGTRIIYDDGSAYHQEIIVAHIVAFEKYNSQTLIIKFPNGREMLRFDNTTDRDTAY